jgi:hypothetical protein
MALKFHGGEFPAPIPPSFRFVLSSKSAFAENGARQPAMGS